MMEKRGNGMGNKEVRRDDRLDRAQEKTPDRVPMNEYRTEVIECIRNNPSAVIIGETGSGKTTRIPDFLLDAFPESKIAITQPRRVATRSVSKYVAERRGENIGESIGYKVRFEDETTEGTRACFMTDGILLRKLQADPLLREYDIVMVDEAHERSLNIDFTLGLLKRAQAGRRAQDLSELKLIVTSATIEKQQFANYFSGAPVIEVPGRMYPVDIQYEYTDVEDHTKRAATCVQDIVTSREPGDILIFMPGLYEIKKTIQEIENLHIRTIEVFPLHSEMTPEDQAKALKSNRKRRVIVATNIAETSITIDGVCHVIDSGMIKQKEFNPKTGIEALLTHSHAQSGCQQRAGRAGRTAPGKCYRLYTEEDFDQRLPFQIPEILRLNIDHIILSMKKIGIDDVRGFDFIDRPTDIVLEEAIQTLKILGALDEKEQLTPIGETMADLPLRPELARMVIEAKKFGCMESIITIASMIGDKSIFSRPRDRADEADVMHAIFKAQSEGSDFMMMLNVWNTWVASGFDTEWARNCFLNVGQLFTIKDTRYELMEELKKVGIPIVERHRNTEGIQKAIVSGLIQYLMESSFFFSYKRMIRTSVNDDIYIHPSSASFGKIPPRYLIGFRIATNDSGKTYARICQPVNPTWIPEIAPYLVRSVTSGSYYDFEQGCVVEKREHALIANPSATLATSVRVAENTEHTRRLFVDAILQEDQDISSTVHNRVVMDTLRLLHHRSGGEIMIPDIYAFYDRVLNGIYTKERVQQVDERLKLDLSKYCSEDQKKEIDRLYPDHIVIKEQRIPITYQYSSGKDHFIATLNIPKYLLKDIDVKDIPMIGKDNRPKIMYCTQYEDFQISDENIDQLKIKMRRQEERDLRSREYSVPIRIPRVQNTIEDLRGKFVSRLSTTSAQPASAEESIKAVTEKLRRRKEAVQEAEQKEMTEEIRKTFLSTLDETLIYIDDVRSVPEPKAKETKSDKKISEIRERAKNIRKDWRETCDEIEKITNVARARGLVGTIVQRATKVAEEMARVQNEREDWAMQFQQYRVRMDIIAERDGIDMNAELREKIKLELIQLAKRQGEVENMDEALGDILIASI